MTIDTQEALRLLDLSVLGLDRNGPQYKTLMKLRALLSAKEWEPSAANWRKAVFEARGLMPSTRERTLEWIEQRAIALRDAEKEKGNAG